MGVKGDQIKWIVQNLIRLKVEKSVGQGRWVRKVELGETGRTVRGKGP